jgi:hypothetical protein
MGEAEAAVVDRVLARMAGLAVRGALTERGQRMVVFSVVDFLVRARKGTPTYGEASCWFRGLRGNKDYEDQLRYDVVYVELARGGKSYPTACMNLLGLRRLLTCLHSEAEPEFRRAFAAVCREFLSY